MTANTALELAGEIIADIDRDIAAGMTLFRGDRIPADVEGFVLLGVEVRRTRSKNALATWFAPAYALTVTVRRYACLAMSNSAVSAAEIAAPVTSH